MNKPKQIEIGDSVEFQGGWYLVDDIVDFKTYSGNHVMLKLKDFNNPVPILNVKLIKQNAS